MTNPKVKTRKVEQKYITLRDPGREYGTPGSSFYGVKKAQNVHISLSQLYEFRYYSDSNYRGLDTAYIDFNAAEERALSTQGWADYATRGGVWSTKEFKEWFTTVEDDIEAGV